MVNPTLDPPAVHTPRPSPLTFAWLFAMLACTMRGSGMPRAGGRRCKRTWLTGGDLRPSRLDMWPACNTPHLDELCAPYPQLVVVFPALLAIVCLTMTS
jgi:hypothetical protein